MQLRLLQQLQFQGISLEDRGEEFALLNYYWYTSSTCGISIQFVTI